MYPNEHFNSVLCYQNNNLITHAFSYFMKAFLRKAFYLYYDGFRNMKLGKTLWLIILIKLFIMFAILKVFFFPNQLKKDFEDDQQRSNHVLEQLTNTK
jgi:hypothetical protein